MYFHSHRNPGLVVDILSDLKRLNTMAVKALNSGVIIVGGGLIKHHICNANLMVGHRIYSNSMILYECTNRLCFCHVFRETVPTFLCS